MTALLNSINGWKTYLASAGLLGYAVFLASKGQYPEAFQAFLQALTAAGLRHAVAKAAGK